MKKIVHLSDLHFGKADYKRVVPLLEAVDRINPHIVVISGDFTQRAKEKEFIEAQKFLCDLSRPFFVVPGNHDVPLYDVFRRFHMPFQRYCQYISDDLSPFFTDEEIALIGVNSARSFAISSGRISKKQVEEMEEKIKKLKPEILKIVVSHHPFELPRKKHHRHTHKVIGRSKMAMERLAKHNIDIFLSGHLHLHNICDTTLRYKIENYSALIVQAGTAISVRSRGEPVSFNTLYVSTSETKVEHYAGDTEGFHYNLCNTETFTRAKDGWRVLA